LRCATWPALDRLLAVNPHPSVSGSLGRRNWNSGGRRHRRSSPIAGSSGSSVTVATPHAVARRWCNRSRTPCQAGSTVAPHSSPPRPVHRGSPSSVEGSGEYRSSAPAGGFASAGLQGLVTARAGWLEPKAWAPIGAAMRHDSARASHGPGTVPSRTRDPPVPAN
jgi:hypothetical protein